MTSNPYRWDKINLRLFYGRHELLAHILNDLKENHSCAIVGGRKMGKTTLLRKIESDLSADIDSSLAGGLLVLPIYVHTLALPHPLRPITIYADIVRQIERNLKELKLIKSLSLPARSIFEEFPQEENRAFSIILKNFVESVASRCYLQVVILIDEIEPLIREEWGEGFFSNWRHLLSNELELSPHITAVISGAREMITIAKDVGSPLANIMSWYELSLFSRTETGRLINEPTKNQLPTAVVREIYKITGGHPFLIQFLMQYICKFDLSEAKERLFRATDHFLKQHEGQFHNWWFEKLTDNDRKVYAFLAERDKAVLKREVVDIVGDVIANRALAVLCHTGIALRHPKNEAYRVTGTLFKSWYKKHGIIKVGDEYNGDPITKGLTINVFDQRGQQVGYQYNAAGDIKLAYVQSRVELINELVKLNSEFSLAIQQKVFTKEVANDARSKLALAVLEANKPQPSKQMLLEHISRARQLIGRTSSAGELTAALIKAAELIDIYF